MIKKGKIAKKSLALFVALTMVMSTMVLVPATVFAAGEATHTEFTKMVDKDQLTGGALVFSGEGIKDYSGFNGSYKVLPKTDIASLKNIQQAEKLFPGKLSSALWQNNNYSALSGQGFEFISDCSGLGLEAVAESLGITVDKKMSLFVKATDGTIDDIQSVFVDRYSYAEESATEGTPYEPILALTGKGVPEADVPQIMFGQKAGGAKTDYNKQDWVKNVCAVSFGDEPIVLETYVNNSSVESDSIADLMQKGRYTTTYTTYNGNVATQSEVEGIPLKNLLNEWGVTPYVTGVKIIAPADEFTISKEDIDDTFVAWAYTDETKDPEQERALMVFTKGADSATSSSPTSICKNVTDFEVTAKIAKPVIKLAKYGKKSVKISWKAVDGATDYQIYKKAPGKKFKAFKTVTAKKLKFVDKKVKKGKKYSYKVRALVDAGSVDMQGAFSKVKTIRR